MGDTRQNSLVCDVCQKTSSRMWTRSTLLVDRTDLGLSDFRRDGVYLVEERTVLTTPKKTVTMHICDTCVESKRKAHKRNQRIWAAVWLLAVGGIILGLRWSGFNNLPAIVGLLALLFVMASAISFPLYVLSMLGTPWMDDLFKWDWESFVAKECREAHLWPSNDPKSCFSPPR